MNILFLDDDFARHENFTPIFPNAIRCMTAAQCIKELSYRTYDTVFLDHDLGGKVFVDPDGEDTGMEVVRWIEQNKPKVDRFIVHSWNSSAGPVMMDRLLRAGYKAYYIPFDPVVIRKLKR